MTDIAAATTRAILTADGRVLIEQPDGSFRPAEGETDWQRIDRMTEEELAAVIASDPDDPANDPAFWERARLMHPRPKRRVTVSLDADVLDWFRALGKGYQGRMNAVLRSYIEARRREPGSSVRGR